MQQISCTMLVHSMAGHLQQLYTGFTILQKKGLIRLSQRIIRNEARTADLPNHLRDAWQSYLRVIINDKIRLHYDTHDSWEVDAADLKNCDFYFKRSYSPSLIKGLGKEKDKVFPLGMNYLVLANKLDYYAFQRTLNLTNGMDMIKSIIYSLMPINLRFSPRVDTMEASPDYDKPPKILFMAQAWDPYDDKDRSEDKIKERMTINETRAQCIELLRKEFKDDFCGGFAHTNYALKNYQNVLLPDKNLSSKKNYIRLLKSYPICIATSGLHGSIGWKMGEYIAFSKAILSERLNYKVPGQLISGRNYIEFYTPEDCVEKAKQLFLDRKLRNKLMTNNANYYQSHLRPDSLVMDTINVALSAKVA